ncbi:hypothetical protein M422DRAFT_33218 [Sphaerobolus stellatus SS14]|uniref:Uncharacterized protein n=1 Tax=Sphaerobolus stellatus (strain SS14) TaxID=990650 RepID=A0A0C9U6J8_SPHS4|nr:hypothetical protein M422DRAFT_33218 [Sphaerobolus stellatus SS14]
MYTDLRLTPSSIPWNNLTSLHLPVSDFIWFPKSIPLLKLRWAYVIVRTIQEWNLFYKAISFPQIRELTSMPAVCSMRMEYIQCLESYWTADLQKLRINISCWNQEHGTRLQVNVYLLLQDPDGIQDPEEPASEACDLFGMMSAVTRFKFTECTSFYPSIRPSPFVGILELQDTRYLGNLEMWIYGIPEDSFASLTAIILPKEIHGWRWQFVQRILERLVPNSDKPEIIVVGEDMAKNTREELQGFCNEYGVLWRFE